MTVKRTKYRAIPTVVDGIRFDSAAEARRYGTLKLLQDAGKIAELRLQPPFPLVVNGQKIATYRADFSYVQGGQTVVEDVKGIRTKDFVIKEKLVRALHGVTVHLIPA